ncbi:MULTISPECIES: helix-turn-helix domain-containing protein [Maribacter]|jgi:transcriptional regulator with XRE-family HTH domain|uniref:HTH cro/C1-type domain-containing protein n=1 Tax=marine sediment metagenome TaxID=412755 RepID=A0A0F9TT53_9ZZZZ|nr:helix-turn-helix transcriptional regulator [Maribacter litoralis]|tara:strand:- start:1306 stop:1563 length:258 start_codon:yes stop_codon:yes gene_type:complete
MKNINDKELLTSISIVLKELRAIEGLTQQNVKDDTGIHIGRIETTRNDPSSSTIFELCKYFKISLSQFYKRLEEINPNLNINNKF